MDRRAFNEIVERFQRRVFRVAYAVVRNIEEADDITQEVFVKLYHHMDRMKKPEAIQAWLTRAAVSTARDHLRWIKVRSWLGGKTQDADEIGTTASSPEKIAAANERNQIIKTWTEANLSTKERLVFQLRFGEEMTIAEIAESLSMNENTVKTHLYRAEKKLNEEQLSER